MNPASDTDEDAWTTQLLRFLEGDVVEDSSVHRLFTVPDLLREIAERLDRTQDQYRFARTCRFIWANCVDIFWRIADEEKLSHLFPSQLDSFCPPSLLSPTPDTFTMAQQVALNKYLPNLKILVLQEYLNDPPDYERRCGAIYCCVAGLRLYSLNNDTMPALRTLILTAQYAATALDCITLLGEHGLLSLSLLLFTEVADEDDQGPPVKAVVALFEVIGTTLASTLHSLHLEMGHVVYSPEALLQLGEGLTHLLPQLTELRSFRLGHFASAHLSAHLSALAKLRDLYYLQIWGPGPINPSENTEFPSLRLFRAAHTNPVVALNCIPPERLATLYLQF